MKVCKKSEFLQGHLAESKNKLMKCELIFRLDNSSYYSIESFNLFQQHREAWPRTLIPAIRYLTVALNTLIEWL